MASFLVLIVVIGVAFLFFSRSHRISSRDWVQFLTVGQEAGFSLKELETLHRVAVQNNIEDPSSIFLLQAQLDICIRYLVRAIRNTAGGGGDQGIQDFLSKLYNYRKKIEMNKPHNRGGISNSHQITEGQHLRIMVTGIGVYMSQVIRNTSPDMTISRPVNTDITVPITWQGTKISVNFWRENDAGYVFESNVLDEVFSRGLASLKIAHSNSLVRTQKRNSIRLRMRGKAAFLYLASEGERPHTAERQPGLRCLLDDLSDSGCAVIVGGKVGAGLRVKIQFSLSERPVSMTGTVRSVSFREEINQSILHIESEPLPIEMRNQILGEVFGMPQNDVEDDVSFDTLEGAVAAAAGEDGSAPNISVDDTISWPPPN